ncbi:hypothetical protein F1880_001394 [Penicillium rolfsii]|nr:hypothetical protein F1880_001394 [Penicillium rolfsii]
MAEGTLERDGAGPSRDRSLFVQWDSQPKRKDKRRTRKPVNCAPCRLSKLKCDRKIPCAACEKRDRVESCHYRKPDSDNARGIDTAFAKSPGAQDYSQVRKTQAPSTHLSATTPTQTTASLAPSEPGQQGHQDDSHREWDALLQRPMDAFTPTMAIPNDPFTSPRNIAFPFPFGPTVTKHEVLAILPPPHCCDYIVTKFFTRLSPLFHILHGPTFQKQYNAFRQDSSETSLSWVALLFAICSATMNTMEKDDTILLELWPQLQGNHDIAELAYRFRTAALICLSLDQFMIRHNLSTLEALLILVYTISNHEGAERAWALLGLTLNIGVALKCNAESNGPHINFIDVERRRRCWAGILLVHTYQATFFRDVDMSALLNIEATMPADVNDNDIREEGITSPSSQPTQMSLMTCKIRMFKLSTKVCRHLASTSKFDEVTLSLLDSQVAEEQRQWDNIFLVDGSPSVLDPSSYAHWCILQLYAHQLYLLLHRPFCKSRGPCFRSASQVKCIISGSAMLDVHRQFCELPRLRHYKWLLSGLTSFYAIHGAIALVSCLLDEPQSLDLSPYRADFDAAIARIDKLQNKSQVCSKAYPVLAHLQTLLLSERLQSSDVINYEFDATFDDWIDNVQWLNPTSIDWTFWDDILGGEGGALKL